MTTRKKAPARMAKTQPPIFNWLKAYFEGDPRALELLPNSFDLVTKARAGDATAARRVLMHCFMAFLKCPNPGWQKRLESDYAVYLADALEKIIDGADANNALGIKNPRGRKSKEETGQRREAIAAAIALLSRQDYERQSIVDWVVANGGFSLRSIQRALQENPWVLDPAVEENLLKLAAAPLAPLIQRFRDAKRRR